jgi:hypothetical protein
MSGSMHRSIQLCYVCVDECSRHVRAEWINPNEIAGLTTKRTQIARAGRELCALINYSNNLLSARREIRSIVSFPERKSRTRASCETHRIHARADRRVITRMPPGNKSRVSQRIAQACDRSLQHVSASVSRQRYSRPNRTRNAALHKTRSDEVYPRQCPCRRAFDLGSELRTWRTRRRSNESRRTQGFTQVQPPRKVKGLRPACLTFVLRW